MLDLLSSTRVSAVSLLIAACSSGSDGSTTTPQASGTSTLTATETSSVVPGTSSSATHALDATTGSPSASQNATESSAPAVSAALPPDAGAPDAASIDPGDATTSNSASPGGDADAASTITVRLPPTNGSLDYQLGGAYSLPEGVNVVSRDRTESPADGAYNICYINGFQVQPGEEQDWDADLLLRDADGELVIDEDWNEVLLDVGDAEKRERIAAVVGTWIAGCADAGFDAVEIDNLDTFTRSDGLLSEDDAVAMIALLSARAHEHGLAIAQKNSVELVSRRAEMGTDFAVAEECNVYSECDGYVDGYAEHVLMIEYTESAFADGCDTYGADFAIVLRDLDLTQPGNSDYVYQGC